MTLEDALRSSGKRMTVQRRLVLDAVRQARHHVTADEIARRVRAKHPQLEASTVYRNLQALEELGEVIHTHLDDRITRWHRADSHPHGHLICRVCGSETEVRPVALAAMAKRLRDEHGFDADLAHSAIVGSCRQCRAVPSG